MKTWTLTFLVSFLTQTWLLGQVPIQTLTINAYQQAELTILSKSDKYYALYVRHNLSEAFEFATDVRLGTGAALTLIDPLRAYSAAHYQIREFQINQPSDIDADGVNDLEELQKAPQRSALNRAQELNITDGVQYLSTRSDFENITYDDVQIPDLQGLELAKFFILDKDSIFPQLYFLNPKYAFHSQFATAIGATTNPSLITGLLIYHSNIVAPNGSLGTYRFNFQPHNSHGFEYVQRVMDLLAANAPFMQNKLCYYAYEGTSLPLYFQEKAKYDDSRVCMLFDNDIYGNLDYQGMHFAESFGYLRKLALGEHPQQRDIVIYESLPNDLPRVGGMITTVTQTPLSHVNLRAIQDNVPNAFIRGAAQDTLIGSLINQYVYYKVAQDHFEIRSATLQEVKDFYAAQHPKEPLVPLRNLTQKTIRPLDSISFADASAFGAKCANLATMRTFGFPQEVIPDGFGIPFYFYDQFMKHNGFYAEVQNMLSEAAFQSDLAIQLQRLTELREKIKDAPMPSWMMDALSQLQAKYPANTSIRCRSSTNNEDLPGFSGAGLYDSYTHHPTEGHLSKTVKQVFASLWNFRAFDEREFYLVDHLKAAMGIVVLQNFENELANGVGVSRDPLYFSTNTYYLNTQIGEDLVTNPNALSIPEEILVEANPLNGIGYAVMQASNQVPPTNLVFGPPYLDQMRIYLAVIHDRFQALYRATGQDDFAMEIEYKITHDGYLVIKQARPWAGYWTNAPIPVDTTMLTVIFPNPFRDYFHVPCDRGDEIQIEVFNTLGQLVRSETYFCAENRVQIASQTWANGAYVVRMINNETGVQAKSILVKH